LDHGRRFGLKFEAGEFPWGQPFDLRAVRRLLERSPAPRWLWCTHCETSSGVLNDLARLKDLCSEFQVKLCVDCISSIGTTPVDLTGVYLASCASGKGLRAYPGMAMVFYHHDPAPAPRLPRYLDLGYYLSQQGIPFTFSSNLLHALHAAIKRVDWTERFTELNELSQWLRGRLREMGFQLVGSNTVTLPAVVTIALPEKLNSVTVGEMVQESGYLLSYNSDYLRRKNWIQICLMGECAKQKLVSLLNALHRATSKLEAKHQVSPGKQPSEPQTEA
jgi:aspartate aminotransferase-like enzyme